MEKQFIKRNVLLILSSVLLVLFVCAGVLFFVHPDTGELIAYEQQTDSFLFINAIWSLLLICKYIVLLPIVLATIVLLIVKLNKKCVALKVLSIITIVIDGSIIVTIFLLRVIILLFFVEIVIIIFLGGDTSDLGITVFGLFGELFLLNLHILVLSASIVFSVLSMTKDKNKNKLTNNEKGE